MINNIYRWTERIVAEVKGRKREGLKKYTNPKSPNTFLHPWQFTV